MTTTIKIIGFGCAALLSAAMITLIIIGSLGPETSVYIGHEIPKKFMKTIRSLDLLEEDEHIRYFYSDALLDIKSGFYFVTDKKLVLYSNEWEEPKTIVPFDEIASLDAQYDDSFFNDTMVFVTTYSGMEVTFPVSSDNGLDRKFVEAIKENMTIEQTDTIDKK